jgi:hypothetical protein
MRLYRPELGLKRRGDTHDLGRRQKALLEEPARILLRLPDLDHTPPALGPAR